MNDNGNIGCGTWAVIGIGWVVLWYLILDVAFQSATAGLRPCYWYEVVGQCASAWGQAHGNFAFGMIVAILSIPLPVFLWRWGQTLLEAGGGAVADRQARLARERSDREAERKITLIEQQAGAAKSRLERGEFIQSLGAAADYLEILPFETESSRVLQIRQGIAKELRDIIATYTLAQMVQILRDDEALRIKLASMLAAFDRAEVASSDADVLRQALASAKGSQR